MTLRDLRKASGRSVKDICAEIGISKATWYNWESDGWDPKNSQMKIISQVLDIPIDIISEQLEAPVSWPKVIDHQDYGLAFIRADSSSELPDSAYALVVLALINGKYHTRIFDRYGILMVSMDLIPSQELLKHLNCSLIDTKKVVKIVCDMVGYQDLGYTRHTVLSDTVAYEIIEDCIDLYERAGFYINKELHPRTVGMILEKGAELLKQELLSLSPQKAC